MNLEAQVANAEGNHEIVPGSSSIPAQINHKRPTSEEIRRRAHEIYIERGGTDGCDLEDWLQAERELRASHKSNNNETRLIPPGRPSAP